MKSIIKYLLLLTLIPFFAHCSDSDKEYTSSIDVQFDLPALVETSKGGEFTFTVKDSKAPLTSDLFIIESDAGISYVCPITKATAESFTIQLTNECTTGTYIAHIKRDDYKKPYSKFYLSIIKKIDITLDEGTTVYGTVATEDDKGVPNVVVSDGVNVAVTNAEGIYQLKSEKKNGYVFMSVPGGYEALANGVLPQFHHTLRAAAEKPEQAHFTLKQVDNQDTYKVFMLGDMHLANRTNDVQQFADFTSDLKQLMGKHRGEKMYAIALGDMTWDLYWYSNKFFFPQYLSTVNKEFKKLQIYHVIGNHDKDMKGTSDFEASIKYVEHISPTYYSFNIGQIHYVVMDNIDCDNYDGTDSRNYAKKLSSQQLEWLEKDLQHVDKNTPLVVLMHAQTFYPNRLLGFKIDHDPNSTNELFRVLNGRKVHFVSGHTHMIFNVTPEDNITEGQDFHEHNSGSVCASWWWSGNLTPGIHISLDGAPGGYGVWDVSNTDMKRYYKSTGWNDNYQFRSYDLNNVHFSMDDVPLMPSTENISNAFKKYINAYPENSNNEVLLNIWNWNAKWTLTVVDEAGNNLEPEKVWAYDPLHIAALSVKRFNDDKLKSIPAFITEEFPHFFKVKAKDANVNLKITVKDEFGNTWTENMERPKAFSTDAYKLSGRYVNY